MQFFRSGCLIDAKSACPCPLAASRRWRAVGGLRLALHPVWGLRNLSGYPTSSHRGARGPEPRSPHSSLAHSVLSGLTLYKYRAAALSCQSTYSKQTTTIKNDFSGSFGGCRRLAFGPGPRALSKASSPGLPGFWGSPFLLLFVPLIKRQLF